MRPAIVFLVLLFLVPLALAGGVYGLFLLWGRDLPVPQTRQEVEPPRKTVVLDCHGELIGELYTENRTPLPLARIPELMRLAVLSTEDQRFYQHWGVDVAGVIRALLSNVAAGGIRQGASTITQQLARNAFLSHSQTVERKIKEAILAIRLERSFSKEEILEFYLNRIYFGEGAYGVEAAAQRFFGKPCGELTLAETALLAGLPANPAAYSPARHPEAAERRRNSVLRRMEDAGVIDRAARNQAEATPIVLAGAAAGEPAAAYFVEMVRQDLMDRFGGTEVYGGGLTVYTTVDLGLQRAAADAIENQVGGIERERAIAYRRTPGIEVRGDPRSDPARPPRYLQGALVAIEPHNGAIRALVGGRSFEESKFNRAVQAHRQPGSSFKPIVFAQAMREGWRPESTLEDAPVSYRSGGQTWSPQNFDRKFHGTVTLRYTLQKSINVATIRLLEAVGPRRVVELARQFGLAGSMAPNLSLALGTAEVTPLEITSAYGCMVNQGIMVAPHSIERIEDRHGRVLYEHQPVSREVLDETSAWYMVDLLRAVIDHGTGYPARGKYDFTAPAGGKTGTTDDYTDAWFVGFIPRLACGVWVGFDEKRSIGSRMTGAEAALPAWAAFMRQAVRVYGEDEFTPPAGYVTLRVCAESGEIASPGCPKPVSRTYRSGEVPTAVCPLHDGSSPAGARPRPAEGMDEAPDEAPGVAPDEAAPAAR